MKVYLAGPIFTERDRNFNTYLEQQILSACPNIDLYLAQNNKSINDKNGCATSADIYVGDIARLKQSDLLITIMSGDMPPIGSSYETAYYCGLCEQGISDKYIIALYDDCREGSKTFSEAKEAAMRSGIAENQWSYINLLAVGFVKKWGEICLDSKTFVERIINYINIFEDKRTSGIYKITNLKTHSIYIGQTNNFHNQFLFHRKAEANIPLHEDMRRLSQDYFKYEILEKCDTLELSERKRYWINYYNAFNIEYNYNANNR